MSKKNSELEKNMNLLSERLAVVTEQVSNLYKNAEHFVTDDEFDPVKKIAYGMVTAVLIAVIGAAMAIILQK